MAVHVADAGGGGDLLASVVVVALLSMSRVLQMVLG